MASRIISILILLFSVTFLPFWVSVLLGLSAMFYFPIFFEIVILALVSDLLFGVPSQVLWFSSFTTVVSTSIVLVLVEIFKKNLKYYPK
jgi:hypothetical protein